jgi:hypothetical protein
MATKTAAAKKPAAKTKAAAGKSAAKAAASKKPAAKSPPAKAAPTKAAPAPKRVAAKAAPKLAAVSKPAPKSSAPSKAPTPKTVVAPKIAATPQPPKTSVSKPQIVKAAPLAVRSVEVKKIAGLKAASQGKGAAFDADKRRELIAAAAARHNKAAPAKFAGPRIDPIRVRPPEPVERHRFAIGDSVKVVSTSGMWFKHGVAYRVTAALPPAAGGKLQYRIKNDQEPFERVVSESQLASL